MSGVVTIFWLSLFLLVLATRPTEHSLAASFTLRTTGVEYYPRLGRSRACRQRHRRYLTASETQSNEPLKIQLVDEFAQEVHRAVQDNTFVSLTIRGRATKKKKKNAVPTGEDPLRGSIRQIQGRLIHTKKKMDILQLTIKYHGATDICKNMDSDEISEQLSRLILEPLASEWGIQAVQKQPFQAAELKTLQDTFELKTLHSRTQVSLDRKATTDKSDVVVVTPQNHDRTKQVPLEQTSNTSFLRALGLTKQDNSPRPGMSSKLRQCNKFVEIVSGLVAKIATTTPTTASSMIRVVDMGCGRGYLTFALHSYLREHYGMVQSVGIDVRPKLVAEISGIADSLGGPFETLSFETGTIEDIVAGKTSIFDNEAISNSTGSGDPSLNVLIALHACDTATDDALWSGISQEADIIVVAPCCHKQVRSQVNAHIANSKNNHAMYDILKHGIYRERISETVTDSLRALLLEQAGYKVQVFEFIGGEHTSKNVMITAVRKQDTNETDEYFDERIRELASFHGVTQQRLAHWMGLSLGRSTPSTAHQGDIGRPKHMANQMPPKR